MDATNTIEENMRNGTKILFVISSALMLMVQCVAAGATLRNGSKDLDGPPERRDISVDKYERALYSENSYHGKSGKSANRHDSHHSKSEKAASSSSKSSKKYSSKSSKASRQSKSYKSPPSSKASKVQKSGYHSGSSNKSGYSTKLPPNKNKVPTPIPTTQFPVISQFPVYDIDFDDVDFVPTLLPTETPTLSPTVSHAPTLSYLPTTETMSPTNMPTSDNNLGIAFDECTRPEQKRCCRPRLPSAAFNAAQFCRRFGCDLNRCPARPRSLMDADELEYYYEIDGF